MTNHLVQIDDEELWEMIPGFLLNRRRDVDTLRAALDTHNLPTIQRLGHNMKGAGAAYGFPEITEIGAALETAARGGDLPSAHFLTAQLAAYLASVQLVPTFTPEPDSEAPDFATAA